MTDPPALGTGAHLEFMAPLSGERADRIVADLAATRPRKVLDLGCGWGELLLRLVARCPGASGIGIETHGPDVERGRTATAERGLSGRVTFVEGPAAEHATAADVVVSVGAYQAFGDIGESLRSLHALVEPGGRLLFGAEYWERPPSPERLANMWPDACVEDCTDLPGLADSAVTAGFRPLRIETATANEWETFESGLAAEAEEWLLTNPDHARADDLRAKLDAQRAAWLRGHLGVLGFAYLTLGRPVSRS